MNRLLIWKFSLVVYVLLLSPVVFAQERQTKPIEKVILLKVGNSDQNKKTTNITKIMLSTDEAKRAETKDIVEAKARVSDEYLI